MLCNFPYYVFSFESKIMCILMYLFIFWTSCYVYRCLWTIIDSGKFYSNDLMQGRSRSPSRAKTRTIIVIGQHLLVVRWDSWSMLWWVFTAAIYDCSKIIIFVPSLSGGMISMISTILELTRTTMLLGTPGQKILETFKINFIVQKSIIESIKFV